MKTEQRSIFEYIGFFTLTLCLVGCSESSGTRIPGGGITGDGVTGDGITGDGVTGDGVTGISAAASADAQSPIVNDGDHPNDQSYLLMTARDELFRISATTGDVKLLHELSGIDFVGPVEVVGDQIVVTTDDNALNGFDLNTGSLKWEYFLGDYDTFGEVSSEFCAGTTCYAIGSGYEISAVNVEDEKTIWFKDFVTEEKEIGWSATVSLSVIGDYVFVVGDFDTTRNSTLTILNRETGSVVNKIAFNDYVFSTPRLIGSSIIVPTDNSLRAYNVNTMDLLWQTGFNGENGLRRVFPLTVAGNVVSFVSLVDNDNDDRADRWVLVAVDAGSGSILWTHDAGDAEGLRFNPQSDGTTIYAVEAEDSNTLGYQQKEGKPFAVDAATGRLVWKNDSVDAKHEPLVAAGHLYFGDMFVGAAVGNSYSGFTAMDKHTGKVVMGALNLSSPYTEAPVMVHNNKIYRPDPWPSYIDPH